MLYLQQSVVVSTWYIVGALFCFVGVVLIFILIEVERRRDRVAVLIVQMEDFAELYDIVRLSLPIERRERIFRAEYFKKAKGWNGQSSDCRRDTSILLSLSRWYFLSARAMADSVRNVVPIAERPSWWPPLKGGSERRKYYI